MVIFHERMELQLNIFSAIGNFLQNGLLFSGIEFSFNPFPLAVFICIVISYLLGSINCAVLVSRMFYGEDIRTKGSGNAGLTNTMRVYGKHAGIYVLLGDILKTVLSIFITACVFGFQYAYSFALMPVLYLSAAACVIGHAYPVFFRFKGGKGVLCTAAAALVLSPLVFLIGIVIFLIVLFGTKYVSLASISVGFFYPILLNRLSALFGLSHDMLTVLCTVFLGLFIIYCHRKNIRRLLDHCENKVSFGKKNKEQKNDTGDKEA